MTTPKKPKPSLLSRLKSGIKRLLGSKKKKTDDKKHDKHGHAEAHPEKIHPHAKHHPAKKPAAGAHVPASEERKGPRPPRGEGGRSRDGERGGRERDSGRGPRGGRDSRERRPGRGGRRGPEREDDEPRGPRQNYEALPPPPAPPVPEGPYPAAFEALALSPAVLAGIRDLGYAEPTEIQVKAAPVVLAGSDLVGASQTGTGKTAAFGMPTLTRLGAPGKLRCLILEPTRELAAQVVDNFEKLGRHTGLRTVLVHGGVGYDRQRKGLQQGCDIIVATPGRLLDFMQDGTVNLDTIEVLILDEVDRMLDMGFLPDVRRIVERTPRTRQTLFFSATCPRRSRAWRTGR